MGSRIPARGIVGLFLTGLWAAVASAQAPVRWEVRGCEPTNVFYSSRHRAGNPPCCSTIPGLCPGGAACPRSGVCPKDNVACVPTPAPTRPNVIVMVADDLGDCHYGNAGECRSVQTGTPIPPPPTPNLDLISGHGTVFPIVHNTASWCFPSLASMLTARYQKSMRGQRRIAQVFPTIPRLLRSLGDPPTAPADPYTDGNTIGGYCTLLAGKFTGGTGNTGFDGLANMSDRKLGRNACLPSVDAAPPQCGTAVTDTYQPFTTGRMTDLFTFIDSLLHRPSERPTRYAVQQFFIWYAPRIPHQPLSHPPAIEEYLFGEGPAYPLGGLMNLRRWCNGASCPSFVSAFGESNFGDEREFYTNVWWVDDNVRELRRFLAAESAPHCIGADGRSRFDVKTPHACPGVWSYITSNLARNTVLIHLADNGWYLPDSKHRFTENGFRTRMIVFDPRTLTAVPPWDARKTTAPPPRESPALASSLDLLPTVVGLALGSPGAQACPVGLDGQACDGRDLRPHLVTAPGGPAAPASLRHSLCGHFTQRPTSPTRFRYLLTRPGSVGRCAPLAGAACLTNDDCDSQQFCLGGLCTTAAQESACTRDANCADGAVCLGNKCRTAPACIADEDCTGLVGPDYACVGKEQRWCRNSPNTACSRDDDCPACPAANGVPVPCSRLCEARSLKLYLGGGGPPYELTDLFLDPDERGLHNNVPGTVAKSMTEAPGYANAVRRLSCCVDDWWDGGGGGITQCAPGFECPADLTCNQ